jgi:hypothetical protein
VRLGFDFFAAKSKKDIGQDAPSHAPMAPRGSSRVNPSTEDKKVRRQMARTASKENAVNLNHREAALLAEMPGATLERQRQIAAELDHIGRQRVAAAQADRELDMAGAVVEGTMTPVVTAALHTTATDWMDPQQGQPDSMAVQQAMTAAASQWFMRTHAAVKADPEEYQIQAEGAAMHLAGSHAPLQAVAADAFVRHAMFLNRGQVQSTAGSGSKTASEEASCPDCGGPVVWDTGLYHCDACGLAIEKWEAMGEGFEDRKISPRDQSRNVMDSRPYSEECDRCDGTGCGSCNWSGRVEASRRTAADADINPYPANEQAGYAESGLPAAVPVEGYDIEGEENGALDNFAPPVAPENAGAVAQEGQAVPMPGFGEQVTDAVTAGFRHVNVDVWGFLTASQREKAAAREDYAHWNEEADQVWWQEEGQFGGDGADLYCDECGGQHAGECPLEMEASRRTAADWRETMQPLLDDPSGTGHRSLSEIASEIYADWQNVYFGAVPYLEAMSTLDSIDDSYGADDARMIVSYFLTNTRGWRGETAKRIKAELKAMLGRTAAADPLQDEVPEDDGWYPDEPQPYPYYNAACPNCGEAHDGQCPYPWFAQHDASLRTSAEGQTCSTCGDSIGRDPEGEDNRSWHHTNGTSHDHEAKPSGDSKESRRTAAINWTLTHSEPNWVTDDGDVATTPNGSIPMEYVAQVPEGELRVYNVIGGWLWQINGPDEYASPLVEFDGANGDPFGPRDGLGLEEAQRAAEKAYAEWSGKKASKVAGTDPEDQNGLAESDLPTPETNSDTMWPWELPEGDVQTGEGAANVAGVPTPGGEAGYPQPTASRREAGGVLISAEYRDDIAAVQADPIAIAMAAEIPAGMDLNSIPQMMAATREYQRRGGVHGDTHIGAVATAIENIRAGSSTASRRTAVAADEVVHAFRTFLGLPPAKGEDFPVCGAQITDAYDFAPGERPECPDCAAIMAAQNA